MTKVMTMVTHIRSQGIMMPCQVVRAQVIQDKCQNQSIRKKILATAFLKPKLIKGNCFLNT